MLVKVLDTDQTCRHCCKRQEQQGRGGWHEAMILVCLPLAAPIGLSPLHILTLCGSEHVLDVRAWVGGVLA